jgi:hypothetical protein
MKFTVEIQLGNDAMQTYGDIRDALNKLANAMRHTAHAAPRLSDGGGKIADVNGNTVGRWDISADEN